MRKTLQARWRRWLLEAVIFIALLYALQLWMAREMVSGNAPALVAMDLDGQVVDLAAQNEPTLVYFWATWCPICKLMDSDIAAIAQDHRVITIAMQSGSADEIRQHLTERGLQLTTLSDPDAQLARQWGVQAVPAAFVVLPNGAIFSKTRGYSTEPGLRARLWWAKLQTASNPSASPAPN
jgi:thiol-disulfide isomerase/thioredoxin